MRFVLMLLAALIGGGFASSARAEGKARHVVVMVWDGMRPDFVTEQNTPTLWELARGGVTFKHHHPVYLSATEVNGTAISTGAYPAHDGIVANKEYRPEINPLTATHTEALGAVRKGDELTHGHYLHMPTLAEIVRQAGRKTAVAGAKPVALLLDRADRTAAKSGANVFAGQTLPADLLEAMTNRYGGFPKAVATKPTRNDWTTLALLDSLWADGVPDLSFLWMNEPDLAQHETGPGSERSLAAIRNADDNLARVLRTLEAKGVRDTTDIMVVSDHGFSTILCLVDLVDSLNKAGLNASSEFKSTPTPGDVIVVSNGGSSLVYVINHDEKVVQQIVSFLQGWNHTGVIFTRKPMPGTFTLDQVSVNSPNAPDVLVSFRWTDDKNDVGTPGMITSDAYQYGPGQGMHVSLSPYDMHNTLIAAGPDFRSGVFDDLPSGNVDVAPTVLWILGIKQPKPMDGRVLTEALTIKGPKLKSFEPGHLEAVREQEKSVWHQYLNFTEVNGVIYYDEGNGYQTPR
jgi:arylsulfatase A-like enzyme